MGADRCDHLELMRLGVDARFTVKLRGFAIPLRPLSVAETNQVVCEVAAEISTVPDHARNRLIENTIYAKKTLIRASGDDMGNGQKLTDLVLSRMMPSELEFLLKEYIAGCDRVSPSLETLPEDELRAMVAKVKKTPSTVIDLSFYQLANVCRFLLSESPTAN